MQIDADFPGGNIIVDEVDGDTVILTPDSRDSRDWWLYWYFRVRGAEGHTLTFKFKGPNNPIGVRGPGFSTDGGLSWKWLGPAQNQSSFFKYAFKYNEFEVRFASAMPYMEEHFQRFAAKSGIASRTLCLSRKGRPVEHVRVGKYDGSEKYHVLVTARHHCCEMMASYAVEGIVGFAQASGWFSENVDMHVIPFIDKDGVEDGDQGKNRKPYDHGRDYAEPGLYPETCAVRRLVRSWLMDRKPWLWLDLHCPWIRGQCNESVYIVGSEAPSNWREQQRFGSLLEKLQSGILEYKAADNLPFGISWNTAGNYNGGLSPIRWAITQPGLTVASSIEIPYANANGHAVDAESARNIGCDIAKAIAAYLGDQESSS